MGTGTELGKVRGLGSAKSGTHHWWMQRGTAGSNLVGMLWFVLSMARLAAVPMLLLVASIFYHFRLGLQVVIEDYQHDETRVPLLVATNWYVIAAAALAIFSILSIAFGGGAN